MVVLQEPAGEILEMPQPADVEVVPALDLQRLNEPLGVGLGVRRTKRRFPRTFDARPENGFFVTKSRLSAALKNCFARPQCRRMVFSAIPSSMSLARNSSAPLAVINVSTRSACPPIVECA